MKIPKEKAKELVYEFAKHVVSLRDYENAIGLTNFTNTHLYKERLQFEIIQRAKQCALINIKNSIKLLNDVFNEFIEDYSFPQSKKISRKLDELIKVKEQIENLNN